MKKKVMLLTFMAALAFAGCSNDDDLTTGGGKEPETGELRYLAVNIVTPKESTDRAATQGTGENEFQDGTEDEDKADKAIFILLDGNNKVVETTREIDLNPWSGMDQTGNVENVSSAVLVINDNATDKRTNTIKKILAVLNPPTGLTFAAGTTLADVKNKIDNYNPAFTAGTESAPDKYGPFVMSNSAYVEEKADGKLGDERLAAVVNTENLAKTEDAAKNNPVEIYVERVVAKITTTPVNKITNTEGADVKLNGTNKKLKINIKGIQIANCAQKSYLFKKIDGFKTTKPYDAPNWNSAINFRSYWAIMPDDMGTEDDLKDQTKYMNYSWNEISGMATTGNVNKPLDKGLTFYAQENIFGNNGLAAGPGHTAVLVTAQLQDDAGNAFPLAKLAGEYYTQDDALKQLAGYLNNRGYRIMTNAVSDDVEATYETLEATCLDWLTNVPEGVTAEGWEGFAQIKEDYVTRITSEGKSFVKYNSANKTYDAITDPKEAIDSELENEDFRVWKWTEGKCYYFVDIEHFGHNGTGETAAYFKGIIRNHIYSLALNSLKGPGVPVFDPDVDIIPKQPKDDELFYLAARINILPWKVVNQEVNFEN